MQLRHEQLSSHLQKGVAPIYLISGEEPLLMQETCDAIRNTAQAFNYSERQILSVDKHFSWNTLQTITDTFSLFSTKQLIELHLNTLPNEAGIQLLKNYAANPPDDKILLIISSKLDSKTQQTAWYKAIASAGITIAIWPVDHQQLPRWIENRLAHAGLKTSSEGIQLLADYAEGNLLAAAQEIEKLRLSFGAGNISAEDITHAASNSARFDIFNLSDAALAGDKQRVLKILAGLQEEATEPTLILWALTREIRNLALQAHALTQGTPLEKIFQEQRVWEKRKPLLRHALKRHSTTTLQKLLQQASQIDRLIKGMEIGNTWDELQRLSLGLAMHS